MARVKCCGCNGTSKNGGFPHAACNGNGKVEVPEPPEKCVSCKGTGWGIPPNSGYPCEACGGTGWYMG